MSMNKKMLRGGRIAFLGALLTVTFCLLCSAFVYAEQGDTVTVYMTISNDSEFVAGNNADGTIMARVPVEVPYMDLKDYGLEDFYRYEAKSFDEGGGYTDEKVLVERPTLLMAYIKALGDYYLGRELTSEDVGTEALTIEGGPCSLFMPWFWGHDQNFLYYVNHSFPLMAKGVGATADYILLEDGDEVDVAMFSDWNAYQVGAFAFFADDGGEVTVDAGKPFQLRLRRVGTQEQDPEETAPVFPMPGETLRVSRDEGYHWSTEDGFVTDEKGNATLSFDEPGRYLISAGPHFLWQDSVEGGSNPCVAPPISVVTVKGDDPGAEPTPKPEKPANTKPATKPAPKGPAKANTARFTPAKVSLSKVKKGKKKLTVSWKRLPKNVSGYQIQCTPVKGGKAKVVNVKQGKKKTLKKVVKGLKKKQTYTVRIRAFRKAAGKTWYGPWSVTKKAKVK